MFSIFTFILSDKRRSFEKKYKYFTMYIKIYANSYLYLLIIHYCARSGCPQRFFTGRYLINVPLTSKIIHFGTSIIPEWT